MSTTTWQPAGDGITRIDAGYVAPGVAAFYLLVDRGEVAIIETGTARSLPALRQTLAALGLAPEQVRYIVPTHVHLDHAGAAGLYLQHCPQATLLVHPRGQRHLVDPTRLVESTRAVYGDTTFSELYGELVPAPEHRVRSLVDGETFTVGARELVAVHTRGHANHHFCLWDERSRGWFTGDCFGLCYDRLRFPRGNYLMPATTPTQFDPAAYIDSVHLMANREPAWLYLTHFGALRFEAGLAEQFALEIEAYAQIGRHCGDDTAAIEAALTAHTTAALAEFVAPEAAARLTDSLLMDLRLNAQGIAYREQKSAEAS